MSGSVVECLNVVVMTSVSNCVYDHPTTIAPQSVSVHPHLLVHFSPIQPGQTYVLNQAGKACTLGLDIETLTECEAAAATIAELKNKLSRNGQVVNREILTQH